MDNGVSTNFGRDNMEELIKKLRQKIHDDYYEQNSILFKNTNEYIDEFINDTNTSPLEKAFFLILHQFPSDSKDYIIYPNEKVFIPNIYDSDVPEIEYEIDFALYGGSIENPVKVAVECDGLRSHGLKNVKRDRRKEVNLQAAGWIIMRFNSKEIHDELKKFDENKEYVCDFIMSIENTIKEKLKIITYETYTKPEYRSKLTGYNWGIVTCTNCGFRQHDTLNHKKITCRKCKTKFVREIKPNEQIEKELQGILFYKR